MALEGLLDRVAELLLEQPVGVVVADAEDGGDVAGRRRLAGAHEAQEDERASVYRFHPIRSS
jgi:hypothetical protein